MGYAANMEHKWKDYFGLGDSPFELYKYLDTPNWSTFLYHWSKSGNCPSLQILHDLVFPWWDPPSLYAVSTTSL